VLEIDWNSFGANEWQGIMYVIVGTTFLAYLLNIYALGSVDPTVVSIYIYLQPIIVTFLTAVWAYGEIEPLTLLCAAAIFTGVWLVSVPKGYLRYKN
jgi:drug/metabolite transporter (DMT)-like permease